MGDEADVEDDVPFPTTPAEIDALLIFGSPSTRRKFLKQIAGTSAAVAIGSRFSLHAQNAPAPAGTTAGAVAPVPTVPLALKINGKPVEMNIDPRVSLLDLLREHLDLTGSKKGCDHGQCGACTVLVNGRRVKSCLTLAVLHDGDEITTIEGLEQNGTLHPVQAAFLDCDAFQCGYCTPGQIMSAVGLLREPIRP